MAEETAAEKKKREAMEAAASKAQQEKAEAAASGNDSQKTAEQQNIEDAKEKAVLASEKDVTERTPEEQRAAEEKARAAVAQEEFERAQKAEADALKLAEKNDKGKDVPLNYADKIIQEKLEHAGSPEAQANENESYVLKQQLYATAGLTAPEVLATAHKATEE